MMSYSIYASLNLRPLEETYVIIQLADRSNVYLRGVVKDVLVQVNELVFSVDFYVLDMEDEASYNLTLILLGRPFLKTARAMINVHEGILTMDCDGEIVKFNMFEAMRYPSNQGDELESPSEALYCIEGQGDGPSRAKENKLSAG